MLKHTTKTGEELYLMDMDESHLINTMNLYIRNFRLAKSLVNGEKEIDNFKSRYYKRESKLENPELYIDNFDEKIAPYIYEAALRRIDITEQINEILTTTEREKFQELEWFE